MKLKRLWLGLVMAGVLSGCTSDQLTNLAIGDVGGIWLSTSYVYTDNANSSLSRDLVAGDGALLTLSIDNTVTPPSVGAQFNDGLGGGWTAMGEVDITRGTLTIGVGVFSVVHDGNRMTLTNPVTVYIFPGEGNKSTTLVIGLDRL